MPFLAFGFGFGFLDQNYSLFSFFFLVCFGSGIFGSYYALCSVFSNCIVLIFGYLQFTFNSAVRGSDSHISHAYLFPNIYSIV